MAMSPSRLDPPRVAILPTSALGNNNSVLIAKVHTKVAKRKMPFSNPKANKLRNIAVNARSVFMRNLRMQTGKVFTRFYSTSSYFKSSNQSLPLPWKRMPGQRSCVSGWTVAVSW